MQPPRGICSGCSLTCDVGFNDCNLDGNDGCESFLLDDADNCGFCGNACPGVCDEGTCLVIDTFSILNVYSITSTPTHVFWSGSGGIHRATFDGQQSEKIYDDVIDLGDRVTYAGGKLIWARLGAGGNPPHTLREGAVDGSSAVDIASDVSKYQVSASGDVYWTADNGTCACTGALCPCLQYFLRKRAISGGPITTITETLPGFSIGVAGANNVYFATYENSPVAPSIYNLDATLFSDAVAVEFPSTTKFYGDSNYLYVLVGQDFLTIDGDPLYAFDLTDGSATLISPQAAGVALHGPYLYYTVFAPGEIHRVRRDGTWTDELVAPPGILQPAAIHVTDDWIFVSTLLLSEIRAVKTPPETP